MAGSIIEKALDTWGGVFDSPDLAQQGVRNEQQEREFLAGGPGQSAAAVEPSGQGELDLDTLRFPGIVHPQMADTAITEEYRRIKQPLLQRIGSEVSQEATRFNLIMVTSAVAGEGKTFTALNLAMSMAMEKDRTVLLIDADMISRGLSRLTDLDSRQGLADLLRGGQKALGEILVPTNVGNLSVLPVGQHEAHYAELVRSFAMRRLAQQLALRYPERVIIFDAPPLLGSSATRILANLMHQIVMVVEIGKTPRNLIREAMLLLGDGDSKPIGVVLNKGAKAGGHNT